MVGGGSTERLHRWHGALAQSGNVIIFRRPWVFKRKSYVETDSFKYFGTEPTRYSNNLRCTYSCNIFIDVLRTHAYTRTGDTHIFTRTNFFLFELKIIRTNARVIRNEPKGFSSLAVDKKNRVRTTNDRRRLTSVCRYSPVRRSDII